MHTKRADLCCLAIGSMLYAVGGCDDYKNVLNGIERYDPTTDTWTAAAPMTCPRQLFACVAMNVLSIPSHTDRQQ